VFIIGILGILLNRKNLLVTLMSIEITLLSVSLNFVSGSVFSNDLIGEIFVMFILAIAASESAIALAIIVSLCRSQISQLNLRPVKEKLKVKR
jgi:NADH-quinone oxidoreductase subunit K